MLMIMIKPLIVSDLLNSGEMGEVRQKEQETLDRILGKEGDSDARQRYDKRIRPSGTSINETRGKHFAA